MSLHKPGQGRNQGTQFVPFATLVDGTKTVAASATPEALGASTEISGVLVQALSTNTGSVFVGSSTSQNIELEAGDAEFVGVNNLSKVYVRVAVNGEGVAYHYVI